MSYGFYHKSVRSIVFRLRRGVFSKSRTVLAGSLELALMASSVEVYF